MILLLQPMSHRAVVRNKYAIKMQPHHNLASLIPSKKNRPNEKNRWSRIEKGKYKDGSLKPRPTTIFWLPFELLAEIFSYLPTQDLLTLACTSKPPATCSSLQVWNGSGIKHDCAACQILLPDPNQIMIGLDRKPQLQSVL